MPRKYDNETRAKAVRLVSEHAGDYASEYEAIKTVAARFGMNPETLRKWLRQAEIDSGAAFGAACNRSLIHSQAESIVSFTRNRAARPARFRSGGS